MMMHLMAREGRTPYAGDTPTPEEALAAYQTLIDERWAAYKANPDDVFPADDVHAEIIAPDTWKDKTRVSEKNTG